jgi:hypothetical protein
VWEATVNGRELHFHLAGINNQNFIMRDDETGSWWQQVTGEAIQGPLKGQHLKPVFHEELSFGLWKTEQPRGRVLKPDEAVQQAGHYISPDWEVKVSKLPVAAKAYPFEGLIKQTPVLDEVGGVPIVIVVGDDRKSVRVFGRELEGRKLEFFMKPAGPSRNLIDAETASEWDFTGTALTGPLKGHQLRKIPALNDYWFDWKAYNPQTTIYDLGQH